MLGDTPVLRETLARLAFSCMRSGICPSCGARLMAESASHLVDQVIRQVRVSFGVERRLRRKSNVASGLNFDLAGEVSTRPQPDAHGYISF